MQLYFYFSKYKLFNLRLLKEYIFFMSGILARPKNEVEIKNLLQYSYKYILEMTEKSYLNLRSDSYILKVN